jgi:hypothetical protein
MAYGVMQNSLTQSQDCLGGGSKSLNSIAAWNGSFWVACADFDHSSEDGVAYISGLDCRGNTASCSFETQGSVAVGANTGTGGANPGTNIMCVVFAQCTSCLKVGAGRQIELIL